MQCQTVLTDCVSAENEHRASVVEGGVWLWWMEVNDAQKLMSTVVAQTTLE